jgi:UDP-2,3-diacylglucosamine pyrophosphatase LpxH
LGAPLNKEDIYKRIRKLDYTKSIRKYNRKYGIRPLLRHFPDYETARVEAVRFYGDDFLLKDIHSHTEMVTPPDKLDKIDWRKLMSHAEDHQNAIREYIPRNQYKTIEIKCDKDDYIILIFSSDWHLGSIASDHAEMRKHIDEVLNSRDTYMITLGDISDNMHSFRNKRPAQDQIYPKIICDLMVMQIFSELAEKGKWLTGISGNHEAFDEKNIGANVLDMLLRASEMYKQKSIQLLEGTARVDLMVNEQKYELLLAHKTKFNSAYNLTHNLKQISRFYYMADIVVGAHQHCPAAEETILNGKKRFYIKTGTFKTGIEDSYSTTFYKPGVIQTPCLLLSPRNYDVVYLPNLDLAQKLRCALTGKK